MHGSFPCKECSHTRQNFSLYLQGFPCCYTAGLTILPVGDLYFWREGFWVLSLAVCGCYMATELWRRAPWKAVCWVGYNLSSESVNQELSGSARGRISPYIPCSTFLWASTARCILCWVDFCFDLLWLSLCSAAIHEKHDCKWGSVVPLQILEWQSCQQFLEQNFYRNLLNFILFWKKMSPQVSLWSHSITQHLDEESLPEHIAKSTSRELATRLCFTPP